LISLFLMGRLLIVSLIYVYYLIRDTFKNVTCLVDVT